jgi:AcrR family transcriptional regulator
LESQLPDESTTRERILDAALVRFSRDGYSATSTRQILSDVGMSQANLYFYFKSKEELLYAVILREISISEQALSVVQREGEHSPLDVQMRAFIRHSARQNITRSVAWFLAPAMSQVFSKQFQLLIQAKGDQYRATLQQVLQNVIEQGIWYTNQPELWLHHLFGVTASLRTWRDPVNSGSKSVDDAVEFTVDYIMASLSAVPVPVD